MISIGSRIVINHSSCYDDFYYGCHGVLDRISGNSYGVLLDCHRNKNSAYGVYWFPVADLRHENSHRKKKDGRYSSTTPDERFTPEYRSVGVRFENNEHQIVYYACYDNTVSVGDQVVVKTARHGLQVATISCIVDLNNEKLFPVYPREIICKVDFHEYHLRESRRKGLEDYRNFIISAIDRGDGKILSDLVERLLNKENGENK